MNAASYHDTAYSVIVLLLYSKLNRKSSTLHYTTLITALHMRGKLNLHSSFQTYLDIRINFEYKWQSEEEARNITVHVDSDWAGCKSTRKSTSGES